MGSLIVIGGITEALVQRVQAEPSLREAASEFLAEIARGVMPMTGER